MSIFLKSVEKIQVSLKSDKKKAYFKVKTSTYFLSSLAHFFLEEEMLQKNLYKTSIYTFVFNNIKSCLLYLSFRASQVYNIFYI